MKKKYILFPLFSLCMLSISAENTDSLYAKGMLAPGTKAPDFTIKTPNGQSFTLSSQRGRYVVIDFWASWCKDCRKIQPTMDKLSYTYNADTVVFVGVSFDTDKEVLTKYLTDNYKDFIIQVSELKKWKETKISKQYGINWIPSLYLIDPAGKVVMATTDVDKLAKELKTIDKSQVTAKKQDIEKLSQLMGITFPKYEGGVDKLLKYLSTNLKYPIFCEKKGVEGRALVKFIVGKDGFLDSIHVEKTEIKKIPNTDGKVLKDDERIAIEQQSTTLFKNEAIRVVSSMKKWNPGYRYGRPVGVWFTLPVSFRLR